MSFMNAIKNELNNEKQYTENGALGFTSDDPDICGEILDKLGARKLKR